MQSSNGSSGKLYLDWQQHANQSLGPAGLQQQKGETTMCRDDQHLEDLERRSGCFDDEEPEEEPDHDQLVHEEQMLTADASTGQDFEQQPSHDPRASGWIARHDPEAMESYIITDQAKALVTKVCANARLLPPNAVAMGNAVELIRGLTEFNAEQMLTRSLTANGLDITLLRRQRLEFDRGAAAA